MERKGKNLKKITIIINGPGIDEVKSIYGQASDWIKKVLSNYDLEIKVVKGYEMETLDPEEDSAWIITGSAHSVYDNFEWIDYLRMKLIEMSKAKKPVLGICFGHQLIADTFGGVVKLNSKGWELGSCEIKLTQTGVKNGLFLGLPNPLRVYQSHQDVVLSLPKGAVLLGENEMGIQSFLYKDNFYAVQFHPEFTKIVMEKYLDIRYRKGIISEKPIVNESKYGNIIFNNFIENIVKGGNDEASNI